MQMVREENWSQKIWGETLMQSSQKLELDMMGVCQLGIIGKPFTKCVNVMPKSSCRQTPVALYNRATITALFKRLRQRASAGSYFVNGLPIISNWQTVTVCQ